MMSFVKLALTVIICALIISFVRAVKKEYAIYISLACGVLILIICTGELNNLITLFSTYIGMTDIGEQSIKIFLKAVGISIICTLTKDLCSESGSGFLASVIDISAKIAILITALPLINATFKIVINYIGK